LAQGTSAPVDGAAASDAAVAFALGAASAPAFEKEPGKEPERAASASLEDARAEESPSPAPGSQGESVESPVIEASGEARLRSRKMP
jgi:hypothetical protein